MKASIADGALVRAVAAGASDASAHDIAAALLPVAKERLERTRAAAERREVEFEDDRCFTDGKVVWAINDILKDSVPQAEMEENDAGEALDLPQGVAHPFENEGLDDCLDLLHGLLLWR